MGKIFYLMGKSGSGKDTIYKHIKEQIPELKSIVIYTTRPIRSDELDGVAYHFSNDEKLQKFQEDGKVIELREYNTVHGIWKYFTVDDGQFDTQENLLAIGTLESYMKTREYFGKDKVIPIFVDIDDGERLSRALRREMRQKEPKYDEMCRRYLADSMDFSEENLKNAGITRTFINDNVKLCTKAISNYIKIQMKNG